MSIFIGNEIAYLLPGEIIIASSPMKISTVLGSCVSVCLFDQERRIAGINHYLLPYYKNMEDSRLKYGDTSLQDLLDHIIRKGAQIEMIQARIYGGSKMFGNKDYSFNIGSQNINVAREFLNRNKILIKADETGGKFGRKLVFDTLTGIISCTLLKEPLTLPSRAPSSSHNY